MENSNLNLRYCNTGAAPHMDFEESATALRPYTAEDL
jgi:hypothetical protein